MAILRKFNDKLTYRRAVTLYRKRDPEGASLLLVAPRRLNPARKAFWKAHPELDRFYSDITAADEALARELGAIE